MIRGPGPPRRLRSGLQLLVSGLADVKRVRGALAVDAASFVVSAALLLRLPRLTRAEGPTTTGLLAVGREGLAFALRTPIVRTFLIALFLGVAFASVDNVALVFLVRETLGGGPLAFGLVTAAYGAGMLVASVGLSLRTGSTAVTTLLILAWFATAVGAVVTGLAPMIAVAAAAQAVGGFGNGVENVAADTLIQWAVPREMLGRIFGLVSTAAFGGSTLAYAAGGILLDVTSARAVFLIAGGGILAVTLYLWSALRRPVSGPDVSDVPPPRAG